MAQHLVLDLVSPKITVKLNVRGAHTPLLWRLQADGLGNVSAVNLTGATARLEAFTDCEMATTPIWTKTTGNGQLILASTPTKIFLINDVETPITNAWSVGIKISDTESDQVGDLGDEGLHGLLYLTPQGGEEYVMARLMFVATGVC